MKVTSTIEVFLDDDQMKYVKSVPDGKSDILLVLLHGYGRYAAELLDRFLSLDASLPLVALQAPYRMGPGAYRWFDYQEGSDIEIVEAQQRRGAWILTRAVERLSCLYPGRKFYLFGHSQGAMMSLDLALARPELVAGCAAMSGRLLPQSIAKHPKWQTTNRTSFFVAHGTEDSIVPFRRAEDTRRYLTTIGATTTFREYSCGHDVNETMLKDAIDWAMRADDLSII